MGLEIYFGDKIFWLIATLRPTTVFRQVIQHYKKVACMYMHHPFKMNNVHTHRYKRSTAVEDLFITKWPKNYFMLIYAEIFLFTHYIIYLFSHTHTKLKAIW